MIIADSLIIFAGVLWTIETFPQILQLLRTKKTEGISLSFFLLCNVAYIFFLTGNIMLKHWSVVIANILPFVNISIIIGLVIKYRRKK